jgi:hypothetical protein
VFEEGDGGDKDGDDKDGDWDELKDRDAWKGKDLLNPDADDEVLCDQGDDAVWESANKKYGELLEAQRNLGEAIAELVGNDVADSDPVTQDGPWSVAKEAKRLADEAKVAHEGEVATYLSNFTNARQAVLDAIAASTDGSDETSAK